MTLDVGYLAVTGSASKRQGDGYRGDPVRRVGSRGPSRGEPHSRTSA